MFLDVIMEALHDSIGMLPMLFAAYLAIEYIERHHGEAIERILVEGGRWGCVPGALLGCLPQCGFSAAAANFYSSRVITLGTLTAVFVATSDEAVPLLVAEPSLWPRLGLLVVLKAACGILFGLLVDLVIIRFLPTSLRGGFTGHADEVDCHEEHEEESGIFVSALRHTVEIFLFILLFNVVIGAAMESIGADSVGRFLSGLGVLQPFVAALVGLVPNCAASVLLVGLYQGGAITFAGMTAGLCSGAGVGLAVLWRTNPRWKQNLFITAMLWAMGAGVGLMVMLLGL